MNEVLAVVETTAAGAPVIEAATALADLLAAQVRTVEAPDRDPAARAALVLAELRPVDTLLGVLAGEPSPQATCWRVAGSTAKPLLLVPQAMPRRPPGISRVLLPLDGSAESTAAVAHATDLLSRAGVELVVLHVFDEATVPRFWDQAAHSWRAWSEEFLSRHLRGSGARLTVRTGRPAERVVEAADEEGADVIVLGWSQQLAPGRARTVRAAVGDARVPVLLLPITAAEPRRFAIASGTGPRHHRVKAPKS
jgi:nucleotide-binding universal stress UspA family protein